MLYIISMIMLIIDVINSMLDISIVIFISISAIIIIFYTNTRRRRILFHVNSILTEIESVQFKINWTKSMELIPNGKSCDIPKPFHTTASDTFITSNITHLIPKKISDLFYIFYDKLSEYKNRFYFLPPERRMEITDVEQLEKTLKKLRKELRNYKRKHEKKREIILCLFRQVGLDKLNIKNHYHTLLVIISIIMMLIGVGLKSILFNVAFVRINDVTSRIVGNITNIPNNITSTINGTIITIPNEQVVSAIMHAQFLFYLADFFIILSSISIGIIGVNSLNNKRQHKHK